MQYKNLLCPVKWPASSSLLALNWSVGLTITSWTDVSMAVISPIEGHAIGHPETTAGQIGRQPTVSRTQYMEQKIFLVRPNIFDD